MDDTGHYYDPEDCKWNGSQIYDNGHRKPWEELHRDNEFARKKVRVMSGTLMELYGRPTSDWIYDRELINN